MYTCTVFNSVLLKATIGNLKCVISGASNVGLPAFVASDFSDMSRACLLSSLVLPSYAEVNAQVSFSGGAAPAWMFSFANVLKYSIAQTNGEKKKRL